MSGPDPWQPPVSGLASVALEATDARPALALAALIALLRHGAEPVAAALRRTADAAGPAGGGDTVSAATVPRLLAAFLL